MGSELDIKKVLETYKKAVWEQDKDLFLSIYSEHVQVFDAWGRWEYNGLDEWSAMPQTWFDDLASESVKVRVDFSHLRVVAGEDTGFVYADASYTAVDAAGNDLRSMPNRLSAGLSKRGGAWKIVHEHTSLPLDFESGKPVFKR